MEDEKKFLFFENYIGKNNDPNGWVTIAQSGRYGEKDSKCTFSIMATLNSKNNMLRDHNWEIRPEFGIPYFQYEKNNIEFNTSQQYSTKDISLEPFTIKRDFHKLYDDTYDIIQNFILYHNLYFDQKQNAYLDVLREEKIIDYISPQHICVREMCLRDYLAARKMILVRCHDHKRQGNNSVVKVLGKEREEIERKSDSYNYKIFISQTHANKAFSRLIGKDIILPYSEPNHQDYLCLTGKPKKYEKYVYKIGEDGKLKEASYNEGTDGVIYLTPIFFSKEVLQKYYNKPSFYTIKDGELYCLGLWSIPFGESEEQIHAWLGDLGQIPYEEQLHWKQYNTVCNGGLDETFVKRQLRGEFTDNKNPVEKILKIKEKMNAEFETKFGFKLFRDISKSNQHVVGTLHTLTSNEQTEFDAQILNLTKIFIDSIDKKKIEQNCKWQHKNNDENKSLVYLEHFLIEKTCLSSDDVHLIMLIFRMIQKLRSMSSAHVSNSQYTKLLQKYQLDKIPIKQRFNKIINTLYKQLEFLCDTIKA